MAEGEKGRSERVKESVRAAAPALCSAITEQIDALIVDSLKQGGGVSKVTTLARGCHIVSTVGGEIVAVYVKAIADPDLNKKEAKR